MTNAEDFPASPQPERWYEQDPVLSRALRQLKQASDRYQAQVTLNIIKIVVEHQMEAEMPPSAPLAKQGSTALQPQLSWEEQQHYRQWCTLYDTLHSAIQLLSDCPDDLQPQIIPSIAHMIEKTLSDTTLD